tara:strand:+ start:74 stop:1093 length:1020 start_codon:yes stop_codon:yes gene_type:complete
LKPFVSIIILNYNGGDLVVQCLNSVLRIDYENFEVILLDNNSTDGSMTNVNNKFGSKQQVKIIMNKRNLGYAEGNNVGVMESKGEYLVFLNNDVIVDPNFLKELVIVMKTDSIAAAQAKLMFMDHPTKFYSAGHYIDYFGMVHVLGEFEEDKGQFDNVYDMFGAHGAAFIVKRNLFLKVGGFDSDFFLLFEESDLCWRFWLIGYRIVFVPKAIAYHKHGYAHKRSSFGRESSLTYYFVRNRLNSILKNYSWSRLITVLPFHAMLLLITFFMKINQRDFGSARALIRALVWNVRNSRVSIEKRKRVQNMRKVSDGFLINASIIRMPSIKELVAKLKLLSK